MATELLSPAKDIETGIAAINCGCDAVYIGGPSFGARYKAGNSIEDIKTLVDYAHKFYVKIYVTVNTIFKDEELNEVKKLINELYNINVDGLIIQDMSIIEMAISGEIPPIPLHISTQCNNRDLEKVQFFEKIGLPRVVLARELSLDKIREIKNNTNIELECFVHGALCVSYSGQCYLSQYIGGRSANRGECAQPCRKKYSLVDDKNNVIIKDKYLLSTKDFNVTKHLKEMVDIGVKSFKIEGRLKDIDYVKNVTLYYRKELDKITDKTSSGKVITNFKPDIEKSFNRGYTDYFLEDRKKCFNLNSPKFRGKYIGKINKISKIYFTIDTKEKLNPQDGLSIGAEFGCLINKIEGNKIFPNNMPAIKIGQAVYRNIDSQYEKELKTTKIRRVIEVNITVENNFIRAIDEDKNTVVLKLPKGEHAKNQDKMNETFISQIKKTGDTDFYISKINMDSNIPFIPISEINNFRRNLLNKLMEERLKNYKKEIQRKLKYIDYYKATDDYRANVSNKRAKEFYNKCNCNIIEDVNTVLESKSLNRKIELMRTKHCIKYALDMCKSPTKQLYLVDEKGKKYPLKFDCKNCEMIILSN